MNKLIIALALSLPFVASTASAAPAKAPLCAACHGAEGKAMIPGYPHLAGQNEQYLVSSLKAYRDKQRNGGQAVVMQGQAANLTDAEIAELAAYYAKM
ncbi:cytochrome c biogenesis protein CcsB [Agarivorans sp. OAG1]|uniref:c-type cytochrome n=1 Tax=Agarivorans TaxID=261825 RepID=UPI0005912D2E|nr:MULTISPECIES: cytochrome c [Agarivorans]MPW28283.1 c-type cytochrome [Agarivorans sp. B2Z047]UQN43891.1 cytochrome c [Agarivorans sp. B2Z047]BEU04677.1 cytochrome c biogenesis protein CcsB [Agarivorans sp. OAG1]